MRPGAHAQQRLTVETTVPFVGASVSPWQLADMLRLRAAQVWLTRRAQYAHLRPPHLDALLGIGDARPAAAGSEVPLSPPTASGGRDADGALVAPRQAHTPLQRVPDWSCVWRFATLAIRSDLRLCSAAARARSGRAARFRSRYREYVGACALLYAARTSAPGIAQAEGTKKGSGKADEADEQHTAAHGFVDYAAVDLDFFSWVRHHSDSASANAKKGISSGLAGDTDVNASVANTARTVIEHASVYHVPNEGALRHDGAQGARVVLRLCGNAPQPAAPRSVEAESAAQAPVPAFSPRQGRLGGRQTSPARSVGGPAHSPSYGVHATAAPGDGLSEQLVPLDALVQVRSFGTGGMLCSQAVH